MKNLVLYFFVLISFSCKKNLVQSTHVEPSVNLDVQNKNNNNSQTLLKQPLGAKQLIEYDFPKEWENIVGIDDTDPNFSIANTTEKGFDTIFYFIEKNTDDFFNSLKYDKKQSVALSKTELEKLSKLYDNSVILDKAYYVDTILKTQYYSLNLYKNGDKYTSLLTGGNKKFTFNYLYLVTLNNKDEMIDSKIIYYNNYDDFLSYKGFFFLDENLKLHLSEFTVDELKTKTCNRTHIEIKKNGMFEKY